MAPEKGSTYRKLLCDQGTPALPTTTEEDRRIVEVVYERWCGLDIHKQLVRACFLVPGPGKEPRREIRSFGTMTDDLLQLADWLAEAACTHVAMESTRVYWRPIYNLLEGSFELLLISARHIKQVPGRKPDVKDCEWLLGP